MEKSTREALRGIAYMVGIATIFGFWQNSVMAGIFMLTLLWFIEKMVRVLIEVIKGGA